jgi:predicted DNA binding CopG/RHH family protein
MNMRKEYDFTKFKGQANPYANALTQPVKLRLGVDVIEYFKAQAEETGMSYQNLISLYLTQCAHARRKLRSRPK